MRGVCDQYTAGMERSTRLIFGTLVELPVCLVPHIRVTAHALYLRRYNVPNRAPERFLQLLDPPRQLWHQVEICGQSRGSIGYRP